MDVWVQGRLFDLPPANDNGKPSPPRRSVPTSRTPSRRSGWAPVTRDPAVASSYADGARLASDIRIGLARAYDRLSPELRQAIRSAVATPRTRVAA